MLLRTGILEDISEVLLIFLNNNGIKVYLKTALIFRKDKLNNLKAVLLRIEKIKLTHPHKFSKEGIQ
jgi:hypothetical protein